MFWKQVSRIQAFFFILTAVCMCSAAQAQQTISAMREAFQSQVLQAIPDLAWIDANPQITSGLTGDNLQVWGVNHMGQFAIKGDKVYAFSGRTGAPSGIAAGRFQVEGFKVRVYNTASGFDQTVTISYSGDWNREPSGQFYYNQSVVPAAVKQKIEALKYSEREIYMEVLDYGRLTPDSFPVAAVRQFVQGKLVAKQQEEQARQQQAENERRAAEAERERQQEQALQNQQGQQQSQYNNNSYRNDNSYDDSAERARNEREERERREREAIQRQSDATWNAYQQSLRNIENAFKRDPEVQRKLDREREQDEWEYEQKQRRKRAEEEQERREQEAYERELAEEKRLRDIRNQELRAANEAYERRRQQDFQVWFANGGQTRLNKKVERWKDVVADSLMGLDFATKNMGFERQKAEELYASPAGLVLLLERVLKHTEMKPYLKRLYVKNVAEWYNSWHTIHADNNFYASFPSNPDYKKGYVPDMEHLKKLLPYFNAMNGNDILVNQWYATPSYAHINQSISIGDRVIEGKERLETVPSIFYGALSSSKRQVDYPKHAKYLYGLTLTPDHVAYLERLLNINKSNILIPSGVTRGHIQTLNLLISHDLFSGNAAKAYFRMQQAFALLGIENVKELFDRQLYWSDYSLKMGVQEEDRLIQNLNTKRFIYNAAYVYKANGFFAESEIILERLLKDFNAPMNVNRRKWFHSDFNYFDLMINLMDIYAHQERWQTLLNMSERFEADFLRSVKSYDRYKDIYNEPTIAGNQPGLLASRSILRSIWWENFAYRAQAMTRMGDKKGAVKSLKDTFKLLKKNPSIILQDPYFNRILDPLLLEISPKDHKKYLAGKTYAKAPPLSSVQQPLGGMGTPLNPDAWGQMNASLITEYKHQYYTLKDYDGAADVAVKLLPTVREQSTLSETDTKLLSDILYNTSYTYFLTEKYVEGLTVASLYNRLVPTDAKKAEGLMMLNALMGNIFWVRLHQYGPWLNQGEVDGKPIGAGKEDLKTYFLQTALVEFGKDTIDGEKGQFFLERALAGMAKRGTLTHPLVYLLNAADFSR
ncbi:hypothetical protein [Kordiimonas pumila]|uniref:Uncharacterized protein n=1 Tax=Kordiimonas pumila TaxID=2161677 RepID=A0ABV7D7A4_9PROT|nr:hypothetical protein [Kordiimonas pumila]